MKNKNLKGITVFNLVLLLIFDAANIFKIPGNNCKHNKIIFGAIPPVDKNQNSNYNDHHKHISHMKHQQKNNAT